MTTSDTAGLTRLADLTGSRDPHRGYRELRERWGSVAPVELEPGVTAWLVMGYQEILAAARQERLFSRDPRNWRAWQDGTVAPDSGLGPMMFPRDSASHTDGEKHRRLRGPLDEGLSGIDQRRLRRSVAAMCADLIASFGGSGTADLVTEYAAVIPLLAVADLFGLDAAEGHELRRALTGLYGSGADSPAASRRLDDILARQLRTRQQVPGDDLTTSFISHPGLRDNSEVMQSMGLMISAGYETTAAWIAQALRLMLTDPRFAGRVRGGRLGVDDALDEVLWRDPPMANLPARYALRDTELGGRQIRRGEALILGLAAANVDPRVRADGPYAELGNRAHLAWSTGPHACPAQLPARLITRTAVETALNLLPDIRLTVPAEEITLQPSPWTRCPASLPVRFSPPLPAAAPS